MKIRYTFEVEDFNALGQIIVLNIDPRNFDEADPSIWAGSAFKVGYISVGPTNKLLWNIGEEKKSNAGMAIALVSLSYGNIAVFNSREELVEVLNSDERGYRPATEEEIAFWIPLIGNGFENSEVV